MGVLLAHALGGPQVQLTSLLIYEEEHAFVSLAQKHRGLHEAGEQRF